MSDNRSGRLAAGQAVRFERMVSGRRSSTRGLAVPAAAIGAALLVLSGPSATALERHLAGLAFLAAAAAILIAPAVDPLAAAVRAGRVETVEGAVGKRRVQSRSGTRFTRYYLDVAGCALQTHRSPYDAAPDAGHVRAYYLPRTRRLVNLERLPNPPLLSGPDEVRDMFGRIARAFVSGDSAGFDEARASTAGLMDAARNSIVPSADAPSGRVAGGLVREALVGRWTHPLVTVTLADDGTATVTTITGATRAGRWSVDGQRQLVTDATGTMQPMDAALDGDRLTIQFEGRRLTLTRAAGT